MDRMDCRKFQEHVCQTYFLLAAAKMAAMRIAEHIAEHQPIDAMVKNMTGEGVKHAALAGLHNATTFSAWKCGMDEARAEAEKVAKAIRKEEECKEREVEKMVTKAARRSLQSLFTNEERFF